MVEYLDELKIEIDEISQVVKKVNSFQTYLIFDVTNFEKITFIEDRFVIIDRLWKSRHKYQVFMETHNKIQFL